MTTFAPPTVVHRGAAEPEAPLVVLLHGRGSDERAIAGLVDHLPSGPAYAAVRAPIAEGSGYAWFANRGIGRPVAASLAETMTWFRAWLDQVANRGRPVILVGFNGGAAFAGGLVLSDPARFAGAAILSGTLPFDAGVPTTPGRLAGLPVFVARGDADTVIPRELLARTWTYLLGDAGSPAYARRDPGGHGITGETLAELGGWVGERLAFVARRDRGPVGAAEDVSWPTLPDGVLPQRTGPRPSVSWSIPQQQHTDNSPTQIHEQLFTRIRRLPGVSVRQSAISVPGARGLMLEANGEAPADAFIVPRAGEFAHLHPGHDGSLHLALSPGLAADAIVKGWAVAHPLAGVRLTPGMVMVYGPRDPAELDIVAAVVATSHAYARGVLH